MALARAPAPRVLLVARGLKNTDPARPNHFYELNPEASRFWFGEQQPVRLARMGVHGDGSCAYHSICAALNVNDYVHKPDEEQKQIAYKFRCSFADRLTQDRLRAIVKRSRGKSPVRLEDVQEALCDPKIWADETAIRWMAQTLDLNLIFLDMTRNHVYCGVHHEDAVKNPETMPATIVVLWVNHSHFEPLAQLLDVGPRVSRVKLLLEPSKSEEDAALVRALMRRYKAQCSRRA